MQGSIVRFGTSPNFPVGGLVDPVGVLGACLGAGVELSDGV